MTSHDDLGNRKWAIAQRARPVAATVLHAFSYSQGIREDIEICLGLRSRRTKPEPPPFRNFQIPFTITHEQMHGKPPP